MRSCFESTSFLNPTKRTKHKTKSFSIFSPKRQTAWEQLFRDMDFTPHLEWIQWNKSLAFSSILKRGTYLFPVPPALGMSPSHTLYYSTLLFEDCTAYDPQSKIHPQRACPAGGKETPTPHMGTRFSEILPAPCSDPHKSACSIHAYR